MRIDVMTLFPALVDGVLGESIIGRARASGAIDVGIYNIRDYSADKHHRVDDTPYGGGRGMLMMPEPIYACYEAILADGREKPSEKPHVIYLSPKGTTFTEREAARLAAEHHWLVLLCGHYEGVDQRILDEIVDEEISIGDYVLTGGEIPACIVADCVARLCPGVLAEAVCYEDESFTDGRLEYPQYTRPPVFHGRAVPDVLLSGHHANIERWRAEQSEKITREKRPDLLADSQSDAK